MKVLGHIHTLNDEDVIDKSLGALLAQTYPLEEILIVDNGSTDTTLRRSFPAKVTVIRHEQNLGTNGSVITGFRYALAKGYEWVWVFDADSAPREDALERLVELYRGLPPNRQLQVSFLSCLPLDGPDLKPLPTIAFTPRGSTLAKPDPDSPIYNCDVTIWSGCLFQMESVRKIGLPSPDYVLDWGEFEYGYRAMKAGYKGFIHTKSIMYHNIGGRPSLETVTRRFGPLVIKTYEFPPIRCYYMVRNMIYFCLYETRNRQLTALLRVFFKVAKLTASFLLRPLSHGPQIRACIRGIWDGLGKNMGKRF